MSVEVTRAIERQRKHVATLQQMVKSQEADFWSVAAENHALAQRVEQLEQSLLRERALLAFRAIGLGGLEGRWCNEDGELRMRWGADIEIRFRMKEGGSAIELRLRIPDPESDRFLGGLMVLDLDLIATDNEVYSTSYLPEALEQFRQAIKAEGAGG